MGLIPEDKIAEIRDRTDIVQVIGEYVSLKKAGANHKGLCPFHNEKSPSFNVNAQKQFFHCFGCGKSGDVFSFVGEVEGKSFAEVARELARKAGIDLPEPPRSREAVERARVEESERARMVRLNGLTADFYRNTLESPVGDKARAYVDKRGIGAKIAETFGLGYAPAGWEALVKHLEAKKVPHELAERAGLIKRRDRSEVRLAPGAPPTKATHFDVFVDRVVYTLTSPMGEVIGFGGRILEAKEDQPKYKNSPETLLYKKGENLFGLHAAKHAIRKGGRALVVEGNFDVMTLHQVGIDYAVAPQGTAITEAQVALLQRFAREVVLMLDADPAGRAATMKVIRLFVEADLKLKVAQLRSKDGKKVDPDDLARNDLPRLQQLIDNATDGVEFFFTQVVSTSEPSVPGKVKAIEECAPILRAVANPIARDAYADRLGTLLGIDVGLVRRALRGGPTSSRAPQAAQAEAPYVPIQARAIRPIYEKLLALLAQHATLIQRMPSDVIAAISDVDVRALVELAVAEGTLAGHKAAPAISAAVARAVLSEEFAHLGDVNPQSLLDELIARLRLPSDKGALEEERKQAIARKDFARVRELTARILSTRIQGETSR